jgi:hypothetical protein
MNREIGEIVTVKHRDGLRLIVGHDDHFVIHRGLGRRDYCGDIEANVIFFSKPNNVNEAIGRFVPDKDKELARDVLTLMDNGWVPW